VGEVFGEMSRDMGMLLEHPFSLRGVCSKRMQQRAVGQGGVHVSFRFSFVGEGLSKMGCFLLPLAEANTMAAYLLAMGEPRARQERGVQEPETSLKESMLLLGQMLSTSVARAYRGLGPQGLRVGFDGCQGVRADVRPAMRYAEGQPLIVGRAAAHVGDFEAFSPILMLPVW